MNNGGRVTKIVRQLHGERLGWATEEMRTVISALAPLSEESFHVRSGGRDLSRVTFAFEDFTCSIYSEPDSVDKASWVEFALDVFDAPLDWGWNEWEAKEREFRQRFEEAVKEATAVLGLPEFVGGYGNKDYPEDEGALILALWTVNNGQLMIALRHEDREVPIRLCITLRQSAA
jgi:hypothetical protein